jgi:CHAT domain-containing protein
MVALCVCIGGVSVQAHAQIPCDDAALSSSATVEQLVRAADCHQASGQALRALDALDAALRLASDADPDNVAATITIHARLGQVHAALGDYASAIDALERGIALAATAQRSGDAAPLLNDLGRAYMVNDEPLRGLAAFADSARVAATAPLRLTAALNLARARSEAGTSDNLLGQLEQIGADALTLQDSEAKASILLGLAELHRDLAPRSAARERHSQLALDASRRALELTRALGDSRLSSYAYGELGAAYELRGELEPALTATRQAVLAAQTEVANDSLYRWEWQAGRLLRRQGNSAQALASYRAAIDTLGKTRAWVATSRRGFQEDVLPLYEEYADLMLAGTRGLPAEAADGALREVQQTLEQLRVAEVRNYFENQCAVPGASDPAQRQAGDTLVIYPMLFDDRAELLVNARGRLSQFTVDVSLAELTNEIRLLREAIENAESGDAYLEAARRVYAWLIEPLEPLLAEAAPKTLVIVPDGPLRTIPLAVLHDGQRFLVERYALATTPGLSLVGAASAEPITRVLLNGITAPVQGFPPLPFVAEELESIKNTFPSRTYADDAFVTATLEREIVAGGYSIVHMATHARFEADYRRSFLLAFDDVITMDRLEDVMGSQRFTDRPVDLLVLSACQTAVGDERAALGLAGVAVKAGARSALASLWFINDESTALLVAEFYRQLALPANDKADALRGAQLTLLNDERYRHPAYWAPFLLIGNWR